MHTGILNRWHSGYSGWKLWALNKLAYLPKNPIIAICTDGDTIQLTYLILGKKLASESSTAPVCSYAVTTYKVATFISISSSCEATLHILSTYTSELPSTFIDNFSNAHHMNVGDIDFCKLYCIHVDLISCFHLIIYYNDYAAATPSDYIKCN